MKPNSLRDSIVIVAGIVIILGAARYAQTLVVQFLLAVFLAIVAAAPVGWLKRKGMPSWAAMAGVLAMLVLILAFVSTLLGRTVDDFAVALPEYEARVGQLVSGLIAWLDGRGIDIAASGLRDVLNPAAAMGFINRLMGSFGQVLSNALLIMITVMFILFESSQFPAKVDAMRSEGGPFTSQAVGEILDDTKRYVGIKAVISMVTGLVIWIATTLVGLDFAILWGFVAFLFNFVPTIGSIIAAVPAVVLALIQLGPVPALIVTGVYMTVNIVMGSLVEPTVMGRSVGLSALAVFLSLVFWGWLLGPVGMLLSVPLTMTVRFGLSRGESTRWLAILLGPEIRPDKGGQHSAPNAEVEP